jgi:hypothetical protein
MPSRSYSGANQRPGSAKARTTDICYWNDAARASARERQEIRCGGRAAYGWTTTRPAADRGSAQPAGDRAFEASPPTRQRRRAIRAEVLCRVAKRSTKGDAERVPCSSHVQGGVPRENRAREQPPRRPTGGGRGGRPFVGHLQRSEQPLGGGGRGRGISQWRSLRLLQQAACTPPRTQMPTPARRRAARSTRSWLSAPHDPPFEYTRHQHLEWNSAGSSGRSRQSVTNQPVSTATRSRLPTPN